MSRWRQTREGRMGWGWGFYWVFAVESNMTSNYFDDEKSKGKIPKNRRSNSWDRNFERGIWGFLNRDPKEVESRRQTDLITPKVPEVETRKLKLCELEPTRLKRCSEIMDIRLMYVEEVEVRSTVKSRYLVYRSRDSPVTYLRNGRFYIALKGEK